MNRTLLDECFRVKGRENWYLSIAEIQRDLDALMEYYNLERSHQSYRLRGRTPAQALREALGLTELPTLRFAASESDADVDSPSTTNHPEEVATETVSA